jgi:phosphate transport system permease protein
MTDQVLPPAGRSAAVALRDTVQTRLKARHAQETRFRWYGRLAIVLALSFLAILLGRIVLQGYTTFIDYRMTVPVYVDPARVDKGDIAGANFDLLVAEAVLGSSARRTTTSARRPAR